MWATLCCIDTFVFKDKQIKTNGKFYNTAIGFSLMIHACGTPGARDSVIHIVPTTGWFAGAGCGSLNDWMGMNRTRLY